MKKLLYSLLTLAAALTVTSCLKEVEGGAVYDDGATVDAVFTVDLGPQTKALDDGLLATDLYAGLYEVVGSPSTFKHVVHTTEAQALVPGTNKWKVVFPSSLKRGHSYEVVFWAQANGAPYTIDWATGENVTTGPTVTVETNGPANDKKRDAFYNIYSFGPVDKSENLENDPISLYRPFAQINILVPNDNVDKKLADLSAGGRTSSMTVSGLPNVLSLSTGTTSGEADYIFTLDDILEPAFGSYAATHQYMAMNYVLFGETGKFYPVTFEVNNDTQGSNKKTVSVPVQPNTRTNIVGNIFADDFDFTGWATTSPDHWTGENVADYREVKIRVGGSEISSTEPETVAVNGDSVLQLDFSGDVTGSITATSSDENIATVSVDQTAKTVTVHGVADGVVTITIVIPAGTKADTYAERTLNVRYKVGTGGSQAQKEDQNLSFAESYQSVTLGEQYALQQATGAQTAVTYTSSNSAVATIVDQNLTIVGVGTTIITATAAESELYNEGSASYELEVLAPGKVATPAFSPTAGEYTAAQSVEITCSTEDALIYYTTDGTDPTAASTAYTAAIAVGETMTIKAIAVKEGMTDSEIATAAYTINIPATPDFTTVAGLKALLGTESASFTGTLTDAVVSFIAGTNDAVIKDASGSILYHKVDGHGLLQGQTISGDVTVDAVIYNGINEITSLTATVEGEGSAVEPEVVTLAQLASDFAKYESAYVKVVGVTSKTTTTKKGNIEATQDATDYVIYTNVAIPVNTGDVFTAEGTVTKYNTTEELKVWKSADLTVTTPAPVLSATPASKTVNADVTSVTWNITSNTDWTITPGTGVTPSATSGNGNAEVTLSFGTNTGSEDATYTAKVSATGCTDVTITITQNGTGTVTAPRYVKVTSVPTDWSGTYLLVSEAPAKALSSISTTSTKYGIGSDVTISEGVIASTQTVDAYTVVIAKASEGNSYTITLSSASAYLSWSSGNSLSSNATESNNTRWTISAGETSGNFVIKNVADNTRVIWYNTSSPRFACYTGKSEGDNGYAPIQLYKYTE